MRKPKRKSEDLMKWEHEVDRLRSLQDEIMNKGGNEEILSSEDLVRWNKAGKQLLILSRNRPHGTMAKSA